MTYTPHIADALHFLAMRSKAYLDPNGTKIVN